MTFKLIYLARRNPSLTPEEFPEAWRSHSRLASQYATTLGQHYSRVLQCLKVHQARVPENFVNTVDGVAMLTMKSWEDLVATRANSHVNGVLRDDEPRVFADYVDKSMLAVEETTYFDRGSSQFALFTFFPKRPGVRDADFLETWSGPHAQELMAAPACSRATAYHQNRVVNHPGAPFDFAGFAELWTQNLDDALWIASNNDFKRSLNGLGTVADLPGTTSMLIQISFEKRLAPTATG